MSISATAQVLDMRGLSDAEFRILIWMAETDSGEDMSITCGFLHLVSGIPKETAVKVFTEFCEKRFDKDTWYVAKFLDLDRHEDIRLNLEAGALYASRNGG